MRGEPEERDQAKAALGPIRTILVGTSLRESSDAVVRAAHDIARSVGGRLELVHSLSMDVLSPRFGTGWPESGFYLKWSEMQREEMAAQIERLKIDVPMHTTVASGAAYRVISDVAEKVNADLVVVGASDRGRFSKFLGTTADRLLRSVNTPVMVVRGDWVFPPEKVLAPVDFSLLAADAMECGLAFLLQASASAPHVEVFFAVSEMQRTLAAPFSAEQIERMAERELDRFADEHLVSASFAHSSRVAIGSPAVEILKEIGRFGADLIVIGTHGHGGVTRALLGSVTRAVAAEADCPVLVISPETALGASVAEAVLGETEPRWRIPDQVDKQLAK